MEAGGHSGEPAFHSATTIIGVLPGAEFQGTNIALKKDQLEDLEGPGEREGPKDWNEKPIFRTQHLHNRALLSQLWGKREAARDQQVSAQSLPPAAGPRGGSARARGCGGSKDGAFVVRPAVVAHLAPQRQAESRSGSGAEGALLGLLHPPQLETWRFLG